MTARYPIMNQQIPISPVKTQTTESLDDRQEQIRRRAFEIYEQRGREDGHDLEDWLQAESEVMAASLSRVLRLVFADTPYPKKTRSLPTILSRDEVGQLLSPRATHGTPHPLAFLPSQIQHLAVPQQLS